jgi:chromosomal replication initiation ATPase DnaA
MIDDWDEEAHFRRDAVRGSRKLLLALWRAMGVKPVIRPMKVLPPRCPVSAIQTKVAAYYGIKKRAMLSSKRDRRVTDPRHVAMFLAREITGKSLPTIGRCFKRDHTTVLHACRVVPASDRLAADLDALRERLAG